MNSYVQTNILLKCCIDLFLGHSLVRQKGGGGGVVVFQKNLIVLSFEILNPILSIVLLQTPQFHYCATTENLKHLRP